VLRRFLVRRLRSGRDAWVIAALLLVSVGAPARASEESILETSAGLLDLHAGRYVEARQRFERAVAADPDDITAQYYLGVTFGRLGAYPQAIIALERVRAARPELHQVELELGIVFFRAANWDSAIASLERARQDSELDAAASFYLGLTELRRNHKAIALDHFRRAEQDPHLRRAAQYYEGFILYDTQQWREADERFAAVMRENGGSDIALEAQRFRAAIEERGDRRYHLYGSAGFEYDSNVLLAPSDDEAKDTIAISKQADGRAVLLAGGRYVPWRSENAQLSIGYEFFQSLHFDLTSFNVQDHRPSIELRASHGPFELGLAARYDYYRLGGDSLLNQETATPWIRFNEGAIGHLDLYYRMRRRDFFEGRFGDRLDGFNHAAAVTQAFHLGTPERVAWIGYRFDRQDMSHSQGDAFSYDGNQAEGGLTWLFPVPAITTTLTYHYRHEGYDEASGGRRDEEHELVFSGEKRLSEHLAVRVGYDGTFNRSNVQVFEYTRHIGSVALDVSF
jgi:tetratricopeptide (TPR) repeat protein